MRRKTFLSFLILEVSLTFLVILIFKTISDRSIAGVLAGSLFVSLGFYIIISLAKNKIHFRSFSFYAATIHLLFTAIPLLIVRLLNWGTPHTELLVLGVPAPMFHKIAEKIFMILILCTLIDVIETFLPPMRKKD